MRLIDKEVTLLLLDTAIKQFGENWLQDKMTKNGLLIAKRIVSKQPTIEAEPVRRGRWIVHTTWHGMFGLIHSECSECKFDRNGDLSSWNYCPDCGARMDGGDKRCTG